MTQQDFYNDFDPHAAAWLAQLAADRIIPPGVVDSRSITDVSPADVAGFRRAHFFAGIGGWAEALRLADWPQWLPVWTGSPPCFPAGTLVLTRRGLIPIEAVSVGDEVLTHEARWRAVTATGDEVADTVVVKGQGHFGLQCTPDHPFLTGDDEWTSAADLKGKRWATVAEVPSGTVPPVAGGKRGYFYDKAVSGFRVKGDKDGRPVYIGLFNTEQEAAAARREAVGAGKIDVRGADAVDPTSPAFARFLGYWVGNGWVSRDDVFICGASGDADLLTSIAADARIPVNVSITPTGARAYVGSKALSQWLREHFGEGADKKRLPAWLHSASAEYREAFLDGYWLADGHDETPKKGDPVRRFTTVSRALAIGVCILLNQSGKSASITIHQQNRQASIAGRPVSERPFYRVTAYEAARSFRFGGVHGWGFVRSVEPGLRCRVYNLAVDGDESYTADGIVVHNCQPFSPAGKQLGRDDPRHLGPRFVDLVGACRPPVLFGEQVASADAIGRAAKPGKQGGGDAPAWAWWDDISLRLEAAGYAAWAAVVPAAGVGAPHIRQRLFFAAVDLRFAAGTGLPGSDRGVSGGLGHSQRAGLEGRRRHGGDRNQPGRVGSIKDGSAWPTGASGDMADQSCSGRREEREDRSRCSLGDCPEGRAAGSGDGRHIDRLADSTSLGRIGRRASETRDEPGAQQRSDGFRATGEARPGPTNGFWSSADWLYCTDGSWRPVEPGVQRVADGLPGGVVPSGPFVPASYPLAPSHKDARRVMRLRGYGNAIVSQAASAFIESSIEILRDAGIWAAMEGTYR